DPGEDLRPAEVDPDDSLTHRLANLTRRMPGEEKPYRVYRGGRQKGKVPTAARRTRATARARGADGASSYRGPGPRTRKRWTRRRWLVVGLVAVLVLILVWALASYLSLRNGVKDANKRLPAGAEEALTHQNSLIFSSPTNILLLGTDHANQPGHDTEHSDSIMIVRTDPSRRRIVYLSIPRDLRLP